MRDLDYTFAVARIRALENALISNADIERLMACPDEEKCKQVLLEKGWGDGNADIGITELLELERHKSWETLKDVAPDMAVFDVFFIHRLYHNLKAAIQLICTDLEHQKVFYENSQISGEDLVEILKNHEYHKLPYNMPKVAEEAYNIMLKTRDGQLCDIIVDRGAMETVIALGNSCGVEIIRRYAEFIVAVANIKIALRGQKTNRTLDFMLRSMAPCSVLDINRLAQAAMTSREAIVEYLRGTAAGEGAKLINESAAAFERWCDNRLIEIIKDEKNKAFSAGPLAAYFLARQIEIQTVRMILTGKQNKFTDQAIQERLRVMYV